ncbi:MAG: hypothetical protein QOE26_497 [Verrucomicrobiota bacterium]|jgi:hypothetical protein
MPERASIPREDANQTAARIVALSTGQPRPKLTPKKKKNPAAVALGKLGGSKGGKARAANLSPEERKAIAKLGAHARWAPSR